LTIDALPRDPPCTDPLMPSHDLADADKAALIELLRETIAADRYPLSPRIQKLRAILAKLAPPPPRPEPLYAARIEDLAPGDFVKVECAGCGHND
jgi:hypothetical protein